MENSQNSSDQLQFSDSEPIIPNTQKRFWLIITSILAVIAILIAIVSTYFIYQYNNSNSQTNTGTSNVIPTPTESIQITTTQAPVSSSTPTPTPVILEKSYTSKQGGYSISYKSEWVLYGPNWNFDLSSDTNTCAIPPIDNPQNDLSVIEFAKSMPGFCNWVAGESSPNPDAEFAIAVYATPNTNISNIHSNGVKTTVGGVEGYKYTNIDGANSSSLNDTEIYFNYKNKGYILYLKQTDTKGNYDPVLDQVINSLRLM